MRSVQRNLLKYYVVICGRININKEMTLVNRLINEHPWISLLLVLVALFGFQLLNIVYGFDLLDTGFHLVAYENVFDYPDVVSYNFMYYLTNVVGGAFLLVNPEMGIIDFRILGALFVLITIAFIFTTLKSEIPIVHLLIGAILVVVCYVRLPYSFNNGILSCCLYAVSIVTLYKGLSLNNSLLVIIGGVVVGVNIFTRIPNILAVGMVFIILLYKKCYLKINVVDWKNACCFLFGVGGGILIIMTLMTQLNHTESFCRSIKAIFTMSCGNETHNILWMLKIYIVFYLMAVIPILIFYALLNIDKKITNRPLHNIIFVICLLSLGLYVYYAPYAYMVLWGVFVLGCLLFIVKQRSHLGVFAIFALFMLIIEIMGSDSCVNHGSLPALLAAPIASMRLIDRNKIVYVLVFVFAVFMQLIITGNYQDSGSIYLKTGMIHSVEAKGIYTTDIKASVVNSTLKGIKPYVHVSDTMICFPSSPMMNYLTHTKPAGGTCWPGIIEHGGFIMPIIGTPKILFNKTTSPGEDGMRIYDLDHEYGFDLKSFIRDNKYRKVYENDYYILIIPPFS